MSRRCTGSSATTRSFDEQKRAGLTGWRVQILWRIMSSGKGHPRHLHNALLRCLRPSRVQIVQRGFQIARQKRLADIGASHKVHACPFCAVEEVCTGRAHFKNGWAKIKHLLNLRQVRRDVQVFRHEAGDLRCRRIFGVPGDTECPVWRQDGYELQVLRNWEREHFRYR